MTNDLDWWVTDNSATRISLLKWFLFLRRRGCNNNIQTMTIIISGTDYVLHSKLLMSDVSLNIILCNLIAVMKATTENFPLILKIN